MSHPSKVKGSAFEKLVRDYLAERVLAERIPAGATLDRGDIFVPGATIQCKNQKRLDLPGWWRDTMLQAGNNGHSVGYLVHKRVGTTDPGQQWVTIDLRQLRDHLAAIR